MFWKIMVWGSDSRKAVCSTGMSELSNGLLIAVIILFYFLHDESVGSLLIRDEQPTFWDCNKESTLDI